MPRIGARRILFEAATELIPRVFSVAMIALGVLLLISDFAPIEAESLPVVKAWLPLAVVEASHLAGALVGVLMVFVARGLWERIYAAWVAGIALFSIAALVSVLRELDIESAVRMAFCAVIMVPCRRAFYRKADLLNLTFKPVWFVVSAIGLGIVVWLGFGIYEREPYAEALWGYFAYEAGASRFLRALILIGLVILIYALHRLLRTADPHPGLPDQTDLDSLVEILPQASYPQAWLALLRDKQILWNAQRTAFLMYGISGRHWVVMGEPVGAEAEVEALCWKLKEMAAFAHARFSFYQITPRLLPLVLDLGLNPYKIGEEAMVDVARFDLSGKKGYGFRQTLRRFEALGADFKVVSSAAIPALMPELKSVSDAWLTSKKGRERRYSLGCFDENYLCHQPMAVLHIGNRIMAFANLWPTHDKSSLSLDLMRYDPEAPSGIMEFLFLKLIDYARAEGYDAFNMGLAPLAGLEAKPLNSFWYKLGALIYKAGGGFYNFEGLRSYKEKFKPKWEPRYFAIQGHQGALVPALIAVMRLGGQNIKDAHEDRPRQSRTKKAA